MAAADRFLDRYVDASGRVVRHDQGGDVVSEGQAYAMLLAVGIGDRARFELVWAWTEANLERPDGLLSWRWAGGAVADEQAAADADLDAAWALALAAERWDVASYDADADALADAVAAHEVATVDGAPVLAAGPWATGAGAPVVLNPSYASPVAAEVLDDDEVTAAVDGLVAATASAVEARGGLAPDWLAAPGGADPRPVASPAGDGRGRFGWDAVRVPLRLAASCDAADRAVAAAHRARLGEGAGAEVLGDHPARFVAVAAAVLADGDAGRAAERLDQAEAAAVAAPSYYGDALVALARLLLGSGALGGCAATRNGP